MSTTNIWSNFQQPNEEPEKPKPAPEGDIWGSFKSAAAAPTASPIAEPAQAPASGDIWGGFKAAAQSSTALPITPEESNPNIWKSFGDVTSKYSQNASTMGLSGEEREYGRKSPDEMTDEPWYSKAWEWLNKPLFDLHKWGTREGAGTFERGLETGLEDIGSGFLTPLQLGLTIATFGGDIVEEAGVNALRTIGVSKAAAPVVARGAKALMTAGFSAQMLGGLLTQSPQLLDALKDGDTENATRLATNIAASGLFLTQGLKHGFEDVNAVKNYVKGKTLTTPQRLALVQELAGNYEESKSKGTDFARSRQEDIISQLKAAGAFGNETTEAGIRHYITQGGDIDRIQKMLGIAEGSIKPREFTPEELKQQEAAAELRDWARDSHQITKDVNGAPETFYLSDSAEGTHKLGQTLALTGEPEDAHYVQMKNPYSLPSEDSLKRFIANVGGEEEAKNILTDGGYDGIVYGIAEKNPKYITFDDKQYRPVEKFKAAHDVAWSREHVYIAVEKQNVDRIINQGIGLDPKKNNVIYSATPEKAIAGATLPASGDRNDLVVLSVPRAEVEQGIYETNAATMGKVKRGAIGPVEVLPRVEEGQGGHAGGGVTSVEELARPGRFVKISKSGEVTDQGKTPDFKLKEGEAGYQVKPDGTYELKAGVETPQTKQGVDGYARVAFPKERIPVGKRPPVADDMLITEKRHMPGHILERDEEGNVTGRSTPLRPLGAEDLPGNNARFNNAYTPAEKENYLNGLRAAMKLTPEQQEIAKTIRSIYDSSFQRAYDKGMIRSWVEAYHPQAWANDPGGMWKWLFNKDNEEVTNGALNDLRHDTNDGRFDTNVNSARHRVYNTEFQGVMAGEKFKSDDLAMHLFNHLRAVEHAAAARDYINGLRRNDSKAEDGRQAVVLQGSAKRIGGDENPAIAINPERAQKIHIDQEKIAKMRDVDPSTGKNELQTALEKGIIEKLPFTVTDEAGNKVPAYAYSTDGYVTIDHSAMRAWGYIGQDTAGNPALMEGKMLVHPDFADHVRQVLGVDTSAVRQSKILSGINTAAGEAKGMLLSFSPFHIVQEGLRAALVGINPFKYDHMDVNENPNLARGVRNGLIRNDYRAEDNYSTGYASHSRLISKVPGLNRFQSAIQTFLFDKYIPGLKDRGYLKLYQDIQNANPHLLPDEIASRAADMTNDVFGGQNWRKLGVTTSQQDFMRMALLAPDWLISEVRMLGRAAGMMDKETGAISRKQMAIQMGTIWAACRVLNMLSTGQMHNEAPFGVAHKKDDGKEVIYSIRTLPTDLVHAVSDPEGFIRGRVNPLTVRPTVEFVTGRDAMGRRAPAATQVRDLIQNVMPIGVQGIFKGSQFTTPEQIAKAAGGTVSRYRTEAEKLADQYASDRMPSGPVNREELAQHQKELNLEDAFRQGKIARGDLERMLPKRRVTDIIRRTRGGLNNGPMNPLQARFDRLPMSEQIDVWNAATPSEKNLLHAQMFTRRQAWLKQHPPAERENEPIWRKMQDTFGDLRY